VKRTATIVAALVMVAACTPSPNTTTRSTTTNASDPGDCIVIDVAISSEKTAVMGQLANDFNRDPGSKVNGKCVFARMLKKASGAAATLLSNGWPNPKVNGPQPVIWSPAARGWGAIVDQRLTVKGQKAIAPPDAKSFMLTPLTIAMPKPMAEALGWPDTPIGFADIVALANDPQGWAKFGHPEWGPFKLGKTSPNFSTSGLNFTVAEYYAATGKSSGLSREDLARPDVASLVTSVENAVVHYGDTTLTFLNNWFRADQRDSALTYTSAVAVEEKSVIDYNLGNPDGELQPGEVPRPPNVPLVAIYPKEGTLFSDNPLFILDAPWVSADQHAGALLFQDYLLRPENQTKVLAFHFRPGNAAVPIGDPIVAANGVDPIEPQAVLDVPAPDVLTEILDRWQTQRKTARVLIVMDISGSMTDPATDGRPETKLQLAKQAAIDALSEFKDEDQVGLRVFSTDLFGQEGVNSLDLVPIGPIGQTREGLRDRIRNLQGQQNTPLYDATADAYTTMVDGYDPTKINAIVLLTDGFNDDGIRSDDQSQLDGLLQELQVGNEGVNTRPVRIFTIGYGQDADLGVLKQISEATTGAVYDASNPATINDVFTAVVSNF
jgi:Ca-activated chloride channel family protein